MTEHSDRFRWIAATFTDRVGHVPADAWDAPAPVEGWAARDVVAHLVEWIPAFFGGHWNVRLPDDTPSPKVDPAGAWAALASTYQAALDDPAVAGEVKDTPMGPQTFEQCFDMIATTDVFLHTWDLARATGLDETLDPDEVHRLFVGMEPMDQMLRESGQYGPRVPVPDDADEQTKLIAFIGRRP
jgi:uncharacterized protein (TIGR03086 family)